MVAMKFKLRSSLLTRRPLTQAAFSKLPCLSHWSRKPGEGLVADRATLPGGLRLLSTYSKVTILIRRRASSALRLMPEGLSQLVTETGWRLSHGEKSRLCIARLCCKVPTSLSQMKASQPWILKRLTIRSNASSTVPLVYWS